MAHRSRILTALVSREAGAAAVRRDGTVPRAVGDWRLEARCADPVLEAGTSRATSRAGRRQLFLCNPPGAAWEGRSAPGASTPAVRETARRGRGRCGRC